MELLVMLVGEDAILPKPEFLDDVELRFQVPSGSVGLADPGVAVGYGDHAVNLAQGPLCIFALIDSVVSSANFSRSTQRAANVNGLTTACASST